MDNQSNKVLKNNNLRLGIEISVFKTPATPFPPNAPHQAMGGNHPNMNILMTENYVSCMNIMPNFLATQI